MMTGVSGCVDLIREREGSDRIFANALPDRALHANSDPAVRTRYGLSQMGLLLTERERKMTVTDIGPQPQTFDLEKATRANKNYRTVAWSGRYLQVTLMSIPVGGDIGLEAHPETDQFLRLDAGRGRVLMGSSRSQLTFDKEVSDGWCILIPAGIWHNVSNIGDEPMQVYAIYAPAHHKPGKIHKTTSDAAADTDDEPADWSVQPDVTRADQHA